MRRKPERIDWYLTLIAKVWPDFRDSGLSFFPDWIFRRWSLGLAGRVHDWHYCSRCHRAGSMTWGAKGFADRALRKHARDLLPWYLNLTPLILHIGVRLGGNSSWDSCGPDAGEWCRHNIEKPVWMQAFGGM